MSSFFSFLDLDQVSFWIGFFTGLLFFWVLVRVRPILKEIDNYIKLRFIRWREGFTTSTEERYRADVLKHVQKRHLAAPLCGLDEILVVPRVFYPPPTMVSEENILDLESIEEIFPFLPDWPELPAAFNFPAHPLADALQGSANLMLLGPAGIGKTTALCHLASQFARHEHELGNLADHLPIFIDAKEILIINPVPKTIHEFILALVARYASTITLTRLSTVLKGCLATGRAVLILDSVDELSQTQINKIHSWLAKFVTEYPRVRIIISASPIYHAGLLTLDLQPIGLAAWGRKEEKSFSEKWSNIWGEIVFSQPLNPFTTVHNRIIEGWIDNSTALSTPLENVLRVWSAYAGDALGQGGLAAIEAYLRRLTHELPSAQQILAEIARLMIQQESPFIKRSSFQGFLSDSGSVTPSESSTDQEVSQPENKKLSKPSSSAQTIDQLIQYSLLRDLGEDNIAFANSWFGAYYSSNRYFEKNDLEILWQQPAWEFRNLTLGLISSQQDLSTLIIPVIDKGDEPIHKTILELAHWLRYADPNHAWKIQLLKTLASLVQDSLIPFSLRFRIIAALVSTRDSSADILFRRLQAHYQPAIRITGCLGAGFARDTKAINDLKGLLHDQNPGVQKAACLGLGAMQDVTGIEAVAFSLVHGDEGLQQCAAEVLAGDPLEGYDTLREGSTYDQLLVRRAVIRGLRKVNQPWSTEILQKIQIEDSQWVVRNAAEQAINFLKENHPATPEKFPLLKDTPWLIEFASQKGVGISGQNAAEEMLIDAAETGNEIQKLLAFYRLIFFDEIKPGAIMQLYHGLFGENEDLKEAAYTSLWLLGGRGIPLPKPVQFGFE